MADRLFGCIRSWSRLDKFSLQASLSRTVAHGQSHQHINDSDIHTGKLLALNVEGLAVHSRLSASSPSSPASAAAALPSAASPLPAASAPLSRAASACEVPGPASVVVPASAPTAFEVAAPPAASRTLRPFALRPERRLGWLLVMLLLRLRAGRHERDRPRQWRWSRRRRQRKLCRRMACATACTELQHTMIWHQQHAKAERMHGETLTFCAFTTTDLSATPYTWARGPAGAAAAPAATPARRTAAGPGAAAGAAAAAVAAAAAWARRFASLSRKLASLRTVHVLHGSRDVKQQEQVQLPVFGHRAHEPGRGITWRLGLRQRLGNRVHGRPRERLLLRQRLPAVWICMAAYEISTARGPQGEPRVVKAQFAAR